MDKSFAGLLSERRSQRKPDGLDFWAIGNKLRCVRTAFKEWAVVVEALGRGGQIVILRKGGIAEGRGGFRAEHERFWLFPTRFHQQAEGVVDGSLAELKFPAEDLVRIEFAAEVAEARQLDSLEQARRLVGQHIWKDAVIAERFDWGHEQGIYAMAVCARRLPEPVELPLLKKYGGCKSWVELDAELDFNATVPVLENEKFQKKLAAFREALT